VSSADKSMGRIKEVVSNMAPVGVYKKDKFNKTKTPVGVYKKDKFNKTKIKVINKCV
jgi:hypothetical protein